MSQFFSAWLFLLFFVTQPRHLDAWNYGVDRVKGVNAGGWLVLERSMHPPSVFAGLPDSVVDEYTFCQHLGQDAARHRLSAHWDTWITEKDFAFWAQSGLNHVRLPICYWALDIRQGEPWVSRWWDYVVKAAGWAMKWHLQLMVDLHGVPGSQNGLESSGHAVGGIQFFNSDENLQRATNVVRKIARWANSTADLRTTVSVIEVLNEPFLWQDHDKRLNRLKDYYRMAYDAVREVNDVAVVCVHDAFIGYENWYYLRDEAHYRLVMLDTHLYQMFDDRWSQMTCDKHVAYPCSLRQGLREANQKLWTVVGEWSLARPAQLHCQNQEAFATQQIGVYEEDASGWIIWASRNDSGMREWNFHASYIEGWINPRGPNHPKCF